VEEKKLEVQRAANKPTTAASSAEPQIKKKYWNYQVCTIVCIKSRFLHCILLLSLPPASSSRSKPAKK
jgi:hypothetical protein